MYAGVVMHELAREWPHTWSVTSFICQRCNNAPSCMMRYINIKYIQFALHNDFRADIWSSISANRLQHHHSRLTWYVSHNCIRCS